MERSLTLLSSLEIDCKELLDSLNPEKSFDVPLMESLADLVEAIDVFKKSQSF